MGKVDATEKKARFDTKLTLAQKETFERAAKLGGYRTLSHFVISTADEKAKSIIEQHEAVLASERDKEIFFDAIMNPQQPGRNLQKAVERYNLLNNLPE
ncbi:DUF1778 domain-containing protein [Mucilaginibacter celer]|uniref:DUF1778 domain-containing protein n=1 Tax=Mucilaginibacter celer TaxID=2305508 RepID=A0A494W134_9SPHI|nr:DUF1778 domain-containing protein [Mucilaginibacter celer]AYL97215.1 DUF1778 domain-containing protein [Mucilaginibacter celer]